MGITLTYRRVTSEKLRDLRARQDEEIVLDFMYSDEDISPISLEQLSEMKDRQFCDLGKIYGLVDGFINPGRQETLPLFSTFHHGKPIIDNPSLEHDDYLHVVYFLTPVQVTAIAEALESISQDTWPERYRSLMGDASIDQALARTEFPTYATTVELFLHFRQFFRHAANAGDGMLRCYSG